MFEHAYDILVVVLSVMLFISLTVAIVVGVFIAKLVRSLRRISDKAVLIVDEAEVTVNSIRQHATIAGLARMASWAIGTFHKSKKGE